MSRKKIVILIHENDEGFFTYPPLIVLLMKEWQRYGLIVEVVRGIDRFFDADVVIPHIDLSVIPDKYLSFLSNYPVVVNRYVVDISKSTFSSNIIGLDDSYTGPVIIKTNCNYGGLPEKRLLFKGKSSYSLLSRLHVETLLFKLQRFGSWKRSDYLDPTSYPIFNSLRDVPREVFDNKKLIVEKFIPERDGEYYCLRRWIFFGDKGVNVMSKSKDKIIKPSNTSSIEDVPIPEDLYSLRQNLEFDYGKFDYVFHDGRVVLLDVNKTLASGGHNPSEFALKTAQLLAEGIWSFF
jgi:hypothetical protein